MSAILKILDAESDEYSNQFYNLHGTVVTLCGRNFFDFLDIFL